LQRQQEALLQHEKLAAMGSLLASIVHELNNPLAIIMVQSDLLGEEAGTGPLAERAAKITQAAERGMRIVKRFLTLVRQHAPERVSMDLNDVVAAAVFQNHSVLAFPLASLGLRPLPPWRGKVGMGGEKRGGGKRRTGADPENCMTLRQLCVPR
jgi:signal transduction histidine kinase